MNLGVLGRDEEPDIRVSGQIYTDSSHTDMVAIAAVEGGELSKHCILAVVDEIRSDESAAEFVSEDGFAHRRAEYIFRLGTIEMIHYATTDKQPSKEIEYHGPFAVGEAEAQELL